MLALVSSCHHYYFVMVLAVIPMAASRPKYRLKKVTTTYRCGYCNHHFRDLIDPRALPCLHVYCRPKEKEGAYQMCILPVSWLLREMILCTSATCLCSDEVDAGVLVRDTASLTPPLYLYLR
ncbi:hypothetical protein EB796_005570 [Bugula neritina]|uniref:Uncharacterized protein n=1 Tax=Bugula neritina TaxID=10212 RepID=A0A7J7KBV8_BUGNE|nr:hypothetical protein EB796_005570 [Bugula neritina]